MLIYKRNINKLKKEPEKCVLPFCPSWESLNLTSVERLEDSASGILFSKTCTHESFIRFSFEISNFIVWWILGGILALSNKYICTRGRGGRGFFFFLEY